MPWDVGHSPELILLRAGSFAGPGQGWTLLLALLVPSQPWELLFLLLSLLLLLSAGVYSRSSFPPHSWSSPGSTSSTPSTFCWLWRELCPSSGLLLVLMVPAGSAEPVPLQR